MKGFIQCTLEGDNKKVAIAVDKIIAVKEEDEGSSIQTRSKGKYAMGPFVKESYAEVVAKIEEATK